MECLEKIQSESQTPAPPGQEGEAEPGISSLGSRGGIPEGSLEGDPWQGIAECPWMWKSRDFLGNGEHQGKDRGESLESPKNAAGMG